MFNFLFSSGQFNWNMSTRKCDCSLEYWKEVLLQPVSTPKRGDDNDKPATITALENDSKDCREVLATDTSQAR